VRTVITGAASGIGQATALKLAERPNARMILVDRDADRLQGVVEAVRSSGAEAFAIASDIADPATSRATASMAAANLGGIDAFVSNAGIAALQRLEEIDADHFDRYFAINTRATLLFANALFPLLAQSRGAIVATASLSAEEPTPSLGLYSASKAALLMLIRQMALEWGPNGIRCNCVSPGPTRTPATAQSYDDPSRREQREKEIPLGRIGEAGDIADAIIFLLSAEASFISGVNLRVDGGLAQTLMVSKSSAARG
jgi:NAD(P)-dependent dehydrogenase (short-subunit alcohol dehydrogenase family)